MRSGRLLRITSWLSVRMPFGETVAFLRAKEVPSHRKTFWYYFGGLTLFFFVIQILTGLLLAVYYQPAPEHAHESIVNIVNRVPQGWLIRSIHAWSAHLMIAMLFIHMFSVYLLKAYRKPREMMWLSGFVMLLLVLGFGFTGYLLPWDTKAYFATLIGTEVPKSLPLLGAWGVSLVKGADYIGEETLTRMYALHVTILPLTALVVVAFHTLLNQYLGVSTPHGETVTRKPVPFYPDFAYRDCIAWCAGFAVLLALATLVPRELGEKANPMASAPEGMRPEWYFLPLYETLRIVPATVVGIQGELIVNGAVGILMGLWAIIPFIDRRSGRGLKSPVFTAVGVVLIVYIGATIAAALLT
ncbi:MAG TPA: cytochrome bc complex cytochrome b subunit [Bacteroidota bacterium]|nr:cytochrome bc complex cytochrome b subunit [Bacteroidota bacterium]